jgi:hypothetical protein
VVASTIVAKRACSILHIDYELSILRNFLGSCKMRAEVLVYNQRFGDKTNQAAVFRTILVHLAARLGLLIVSLKASAIIAGLEHRFVGAVTV